jgi:hypothetical protein
MRACGLAGKAKGVRILMCDVRKTAVRLVLMGLAAGLLAGALAPAKAQISKRKKTEEHTRRETNASRLARIQRTIDETYAHRYEIIGGGGYLRFKAGDYIKRNNEVTWATSLNYYLNPKLAVVGDVRGAFGDARQQQSPVQGQAFNGVTKAQINEYTFMGGASYRFYAKEKYALSVQGLGGVADGIFSSGAKGKTGADLGFWQDGFRPAFSLGVSVDYNIEPTLALRFTPTYVGTIFTGVQTQVGSYVDSNGATQPIYNGSNGSKLQNNVGFNIGIIYRFGQR